MNKPIHLLVVTPSEQEFKAIQALLSPGTHYICHWHSRLGGVEKLCLGETYQLVLLQFHWQLKTAQMLLHRLHQGPIPTVVFTEFLERDIDHQVVGSALADYFALETVNSEGLDRTVRYALVRHERERRLNRLAYHDSLCDIANQQLFADRLQQAVNIHSRNHTRFALFYIDIDGFKKINDDYGHAAGDEVLIACSQRLRSSIRKSDSLARLAGDEFAILVDSVDHQSGLASLADKLIGSFQQPLNTSVGSIDMGISIGIAIFPDVADQGKDLLFRADKALQQAKAAGGNHHEIYQPKPFSVTHQGDISRLELQRAIAQGEFELRYQPRVDLHSGHIVAIEALLRWQHPQRGLLSPASFFALANDCGLLPTLSYWVIKESINQWAQLSAELDQSIGLAVNVTGPMLREMKLLERLQAAGREARLPDLVGLELEISAEDWCQYNAAIDDLGLPLTDLGVTLAMDQVGAASLPVTELNRPALQTLVIDRTLIAKIDSDPNAARTVQAVAAVGAVMGKTTVAQGVENLQLLRLLQGYGCDSVQGYFTAEPMALDDLRSCLIEQKSGRLSVLG